LDGERTDLAAYSGAEAARELAHYADSGRISPAKDRAQSPPRLAAERGEFSRN